ncbi:MAG: hypothetical protein HY917_01650, partial [Candidatus Diapherotrites archaeon]|nr:hypothetical protein [Candidatus Diapherotrites archaeon]
SLSVAQEIHVVAISSCFPEPRLLLARVRRELNSFKGKTVILLFPEAVIAHTNPDGAIIPHTIARKEGKQLATELHELAAKHGSAYIAYSALEHFPEKLSSKMKRGEDYSLKEPLGPKDYAGAVNAGYLIMPKKEDRVGYKVYPKLTTYKGGKLLTQFDGNQLARSYYTYEAMAENVKRRAGLVKGFPEVVIRGKRVQLRVCSDARTQKSLISPQTDGHYLTPDYHPAREAKGIHLILSPSQDNPFLDSDIEFIAERLAPKGILVKSDAVSQGVKVLTRHNKGFEIHPVEKTRSRNRGVFRIHHKP